MNIAAIKAGYVRALKSQIGPGSALTLRRVAPSGNLEYRVNGWVTGFRPNDVAGQVQQGDHKAIILADDVLASGFPLPFRDKQDRIVRADGTVNTIVKTDSVTRSFQGVTIAYELEVSGA